MPGRSFASFLTKDRMTASCSSLVGGRTFASPRIMSGLTLRAEGRGAAIDLVRHDEKSSAAFARLSGASIGGELFSKCTALTLGIAIVAEARASSGDRFLEDA